MNITCPICASSESTNIYSISAPEGTYTVEKCRHCQHHYTRFAFDIDEEHLYNDEVYQVIDNRESFYSRIMNHEYGKVLKYLGKQYPPGSRLLDFGSGKGVFLNLAKEAGFNPIGIETAEARADFAEQKYGLTVLREMYETGPVTTEPFDIITLFHVLEHLPEPKQLLKNLITDNLKPGGMLIMEVPNLSSLQSRIAEDKWMHLDIPRHISHFSQERMKKFCQESGLEIVRTDYFSWHLGVLGMCHSILSNFGYKGKIIRDLKHYDKTLLLGLIPILPIAFVAEVFASALKKGGVMRVYCRRAD